MERNHQLIRMIDPHRTDNLLRKTAEVQAGPSPGVPRRVHWVSSALSCSPAFWFPPISALSHWPISFARAIDVFGEIGVKDALVRATSSDRDAYDAAFTVNAIRGVITTVLVAASAGPFAHFFGDPRLYFVVLVLATTILLDSLENIAVADFRRDLDFHREFQLFIFPRIAQVAITVTLALTFANYWALVAGCHLSGAADNHQLCHAFLPATDFAEGMARHLRFLSLDLVAEHGANDQGPLRRHGHWRHAQSGGAWRVLHRQESPPCPSPSSSCRSAGPASPASPPPGASG